MQEWQMTDFSGGMNDKVDDNLIADNEAASCQNVLGRRVGVLTKRRGQAKLNSVALGGPIQGLFPFYSGATRRIVAVANGVPVYWDGNAFQTITLPSGDYPTGLHTTAQVHFAMTVNYMVAFNGVNKPWKWDGITASVLANAPADGQFPILYKEKLFTVPSSDPSTLYWSDSFAPETWPPINYWDIAKGDGDRITALALLLGDLVIFKRYSIHTLRGSSLDDFRYDLVVPDVGAVGPRALVQDEMYLYFVADDGIYVYNGAKVDNLSRKKIPVLWEGINQEHLHKAAAGKWNGLLWFALPEGSSTTNNLVLVFDPEVGSWWPWRGIAASCFIEYNTGIELRFYAGSAVDGYVLQQDVGYSDAGTAINSYWKGKAFDIGSPAYLKKVKKAFIVDSPGASDVSMQVSFDYGAMTDLVLDGSDALVRRFAMPSSIKWRYFQPQLNHAVLDQNFEVRGLLLRYKQKMKPK